MIEKKPLPLSACHSSFWCARYARYAQVRWVAPSASVFFVLRARRRRAPQLGGRRCAAQRRRCARCTAKGQRRGSGACCMQVGEAPVAGHGHAAAERPEAVRPAMRFTVSATVQYKLAFFFPQSPGQAAALCGSGCAAQGPSRRRAAPTTLSILCCS